MPDSVIENTGCVLSTDRLTCLKHDCSVKKIRVTSKKWAWVVKRKCYGWRIQKVERFICVGKRQTNRNPDNCCVPGYSESSLGESGDVGRGGDETEVGR